MSGTEHGGPSTEGGPAPSVASSASDARETGHTRRTDGGDRRAEERLQSELAGLDQDPSAYETRDQSVIDRYERILDERRRLADAEDEGGRSESRLQCLKNRVLGLLGLR
jgi:hypothetical protein